MTLTPVSLQASVIGQTVLNNDWPLMRIALLLLFSGLACFGGPRHPKFCHRGCVFSHRVEIGCEGEHRL